MNFFRQTCVARLWWLWSLPLVALATLLNQSAVHWRDNVADSLLFGYYGWCVAQGAVPYLDIWDNKPPGIWWVNALGFALWGDGPLAETALCSIAVAAAVLAFVAAARSAFGGAITPFALVGGAVVLTAGHFECGSNRTETFVLTCETVAMAAYLRWLRTPRCRWLVVAGLFAGAAPLFKQSGLAIGAACAFRG